MVIQKPKSLGLTSYCQLVVRPFQEISERDFKFIIFDPFLG
jgi:hypothetical protein